MVERDNKNLSKLFYSPHILLCAGMLCLLFGMPIANADWHGALNFSSDYVYRGYSKSRGNPVVQGHLDYQGDTGWFAGLGLSQVSFDNRSNSASADLEVRPYFGQNLTLSEDWASEVSVSGYLFNDKISGKVADYAEFHAIAHYQDLLSLRVSVAPDAYGRNAAVPNYELSVRRDILDNVQLSAGFGFLQAGGMIGEDFFYWNTGASWFVTSYLSIEVRYVDSSLTQQSDAGKQKYLFYPSLLQNNYLVSVTLGF